MIIHSINDDSNIVVCDLLKREFSKITDDLVLLNYHPDYSNNPGNFFYVLKQGRYKKGNYYILEENNEFICSAGWNEYGLNPDIALLLTRTYVNTKYRAQYYTGKYILPLLINESVKYQRRWITCNDYNKTIYNMFVRLSRAKTSAPSQWPELYKRFKPIGQHEVYHVNQWVGEYDSTL